MPGITEAARLAERGIDAQWSAARGRQIKTGEAEQDADSGGLVTEPAGVLRLPRCFGGIAAP